ncbi:hypothetical protein D3C72_1354040 [compost metagenome]
MLRQADRHLALTVGGQGEDGLPGGHHLPHLGAAAGDHTGLGRAQHGVGGLVAGDVEFGLDLFHPRLAGAVLVFHVVVLGAADHLAIQQGAVAIAFGPHQLQVGLGRRHLGAAGFQLQAHVLRVQFRQGLVLLHPRAHFHQAFGHLAADAEGQFRLVARAHLAREGIHRVGGGLRLHHHRRPHRLLHGFAIAARRDQQGQGQRQSEGQGMAKHDE